MEYIGFKYGFTITKVKPAYTSVIGALKYAKKMKLNSHVAASYVIARRGMGFTRNEKIPKEYRSIIPVFYDDLGIVYVPFVGIADRAFPKRAKETAYITTIFNTIEKERWNNAYEK
jgi:hypothetical protein